MIEKLRTINPYDETEIDMDANSVGGLVYENTPLVQKINELVDYINQNNHEYKSNNGGITMTELKCPFCNESLVRWSEVTGLLKCPGCMDTKFLLGNSVIWQELIRTRKALGIAVDALKTVRRYTAINQFAPKSREAHIVAKKAVAEITTLEQKDK